MTIEIKNGSFAYDKNGDKMLFSGVEFSASDGDLVAVLGPNGAGKTTLLRCIMGMLKWRSGGSFIDGERIDKMPPRSLWQKLAYVPQARGVSPNSTVFDMVLLGRNSRIGAFSQPSKEDIKCTEEILQQLKISHLSQKSCRQISGGELQMTLIARALASQPEILILDEPESNLDFRNQLIVLDILSKLAHDGMICIFNTHYPEHALGRANRSLILSQGKCVFGDTAETVTESAISKAFGVRAVITEAETKSNTFRTVIPIELSDGSESVKIASSIAVVSIIIKDRSQAEKVNKILHKYSSYTIGRMGLPYRKDGEETNIINLSLDAPDSEVSALVSQLSLLGGVSAKATYAQ